MKIFKADITVVSVRSHGWVGVEYVGRGQGSILGNPFILGTHGTRAEIIQKYKVWLLAEVKRRLNVTVHAITSSSKTYKH